MWKPGSVFTNTTIVAGSARSTKGRYIGKIEDCAQTNRKKIGTIQRRLCASQQEKKWNDTEKFVSKPTGNIWNDTEKIVCKPTGKKLERYREKR